jgi:hypothetical protein
MSITFSAYNLTAALYAETEPDKYSYVVVVVKTDSNFKTLNDLRGAKACFPEFGSIGMRLVLS